MEEIWKDIEGYEGIYQVSSQGRVINVKTGRLLKLVSTRKGYLFFTPCVYNHKTNIYIHRLVYEAFHGKVPEGMQVNHLNERKDDNRLENLNLMTCKENNNWGTRNKRCSITKSKPVLQYDLNDNFIKEWKSGKEVERQLGFNRSHICNCLKGRKKSAYGFKWEYAKR